MSKLIKQAFTLIELLVVIAIIGILSGLIIVSMNGVIAKANIAKSQVFSNSLRNALMMDLVSEWKFDGTATDGTIATNADVVDMWGGNNGDVLLPTAHQPTVKTGSNCVSGSCLKFDGINDYIMINSSSFMFKSGDFTVGLWANPTVLDNSFDGLISTDVTSDAAWKICRDAGDNYFSARYSGASFEYPVVSINTWHYYTYVKSGANLILYLDGGFVSSNPCSLTHSIDGTQLVVGSYRTSDALLGDHIFNGLMDDIRIYNAAISTSQIKEQYYSGLNKLLANGEINQKEYQDRIGN